MTALLHAHTYMYIRIANWHYRSVLLYWVLVLVLVLACWVLDTRLLSLEPVLQCMLSSSHVRQRYTCVYSWELSVSLDVIRGRRTVGRKVLMFITTKNNDIVF